MSKSGKHSGKKKLPKLLLLLALIVVAALIAAIVWSLQPGGLFAPKPEPTELPAESGDLALNQNQPARENGEENAVGEDGVPVNTKYISLLYPIEYADDVKIEVSEKDNLSSVTVSANIAGTDLELFTLSMSKEEVDGHRMGALQDEAAGEVGIYLKMNEQNPGDWSESDYSLICELQESVNALLMQVYEDAGFVSVR